MATRRQEEISRQHPLTDKLHRNNAPPKTYDFFLPIGPFRTWLKHMMDHEAYTITELAELVQMNERTLRRIMGTPDNRGGQKQNAQQKISIDMVDWALTKADGATQLWHLYPEVYETTESDIEISA